MYICVKANKNDLSPIWEKEMLDNLKVLQDIQKAAAPSVPPAAPVRPAVPAVPAVPARSSAHAVPDASDGPCSDVAGYTGFLLIKCEHCGKIRAYNAKIATAEHVCVECGETTVLREGKMTTAEFYCPDCGNTWTYKTNIEDAEIQHRCINCGGKMTARWDANTKRFVTLRRAGGGLPPSKVRYWGNERRYT